MIHFHALECSFSDAHDYVLFYCVDDDLQCVILVGIDDDNTHLASGQDFDAEVVKKDPESNFDAWVKRTIQDATLCAVLAQIIGQPSDNINVVWDSAVLASFCADPHEEWIDE